MTYITKYGEHLGYPCYVLIEDGTAKLLDWESALKMKGTVCYQHQSLMTEEERQLAYQARKAMA